MAQRDAAEQEEVQVKDDQHAGARHEKRRQPEAERLEAAAGSSSDSSSKAEADEVLYETEQNTSPQSQEGGQAAKPGTACVRQGSAGMRSAAGAGRPWRRGLLRR